LSKGQDTLGKYRNKVRADSCAALPDRHRFWQDRDMSTVPALALEHVLNLMMIKTTRVTHVGHVPNT
jgi:hypothetical protein